MRIHTDIPSASFMESVLPPQTYVHITNHSSRKRAYAFEVALRGKGARHTRRPNSGSSTNRESHEFAATYDDWGKWLARLYDRDPTMIAGPYTSAEDFHKWTDGKYRQ